MTMSDHIDMTGALPGLPEADAHYSQEAAVAYVMGILAMPEEDFVVYVEDIRSEATDYRVGATTIRMLDSVDFECDADLREAFGERGAALTHAVLDTLSPIHPQNP